MARKALRSDRLPNTNKTLYLCCDYGMTYSCVSFYIKDNARPEKLDIRDIIVISRYPKGSNMQSRDTYEVPTIHLHCNDEGAKCIWGYSATAELTQNCDNDALRSTAIQYTKALMESNSESDVFRNALAAFLDSEVTPADLIAKFLSCLMDHALATIRDQERVDEATLYQWKKIYTFTVPVSWGPKQKRMLKEAARLAHCEGDIKFVSEPEAAGLYALESDSGSHGGLSVFGQTLLGMKMLSKIKVGNAVLVSDLGGGTSDSTIFVVMQKFPLKLRISTLSKGCSVGSEMLQKKFEDLIEKRLHGEWQNIERAGGESKSTFLTYAKTWFDDKKRNFEGETTFYGRLRVPGLRENEAKGFQSCSILISCQDMIDIFNPIVDEIIEMLRSQVVAHHSAESRRIDQWNDRVKFLISTGGLSDCPYVQKRMKEAFGSQGNRRLVEYDIPLWIPRNPAIACSVGGQWITLNPQKIADRICETSFGYCSTESYIEGWHRDEPPVQNAVTGVLEAKDRMTWIVKRGDRISSRHRAPIHRLQRAIYPGDSLKFSETVYYSDTVTRDHVYYKSPGILYAGELEFDLSRVEKQYFEKHKNEEGREYYIIKYALVTDITWDSWIYQVECPPGSPIGKRAHLEIEYAFATSESVAQQ